MPNSDLGEPPRTPASTVLRLLFALLGLVSLVIGYLGLARYVGVPEHADFSHRPLDLFYYDLQLFVLGSPPLDQGGPFPPLLNVARFAAPAVTAYAFVEAGRLLFAAEMRRFLDRNARGHVIVCGDGMVATALVRRLRAAGEQVITLASDAVSTEPGQRRVAGPARDPDVLRAVGIGRARALYACTDDSAANTAIALAAARHDREDPLAVHAQVADPELCLALQARYLGLTGPAGVRLDFFNVDDLAARRLLAEVPLVPVQDRPPRMVIIGGTTFGRAVLVELARRWRMVSDSVLPVALVDDEATRVAARLSNRYPFLARVCHLSPVDGDLAELIGGESFPLPPDRVFICCDDEDRALKTGLTVDQLWRLSPGAVLVRLDRLVSLRSAFDARGGRPVLDDLSAALRPYGVVHAAADPALIGDDLVERLARVIHESYVVARRRHGGGTGGDRAMVPWERLPEALRRENRAQAEDIGRKLRELGCTLSPRVGPDTDYTLAESDIERLAVLEHERWLAERVAAGWRYADDRDDERRLHPALLGWDTLGADMRERNHNAVRDLPAILADAGFRIVRVRQA